MSPVKQVLMEQLEPRLMLSVVIPSLDGIDLFISPTGNDSNTGAFTAPFATLQGARDAVRTLKTTNPLPDGGVNIWLREGNYQLTETFVLTQQDSGTVDKPVSYRAYPDEEVNIVGGVELDPGWFETVTADSWVWNRLDDSAKGNLLQVDLGAHGINDYGEH